MHILSYLSRNIDYAQGHDHAVRAKGLGENTCLIKMAREINMSTKLTGEFEGLNQAFQHRIAPIKNCFAQLYAALGNTGPEGTIIVQGMGQLHPFVLRSF